MAFFALFHSEASVPHRIICGRQVEKQWQTSTDIECPVQYMLQGWQPDHSAVVLSRLDYGNSLASFWLFSLQDGETPAYTTTAAILF